MLIDMPKTAQLYDTPVRRYTTLNKFKMAAKMAALGQLMN